MVISVGDKVAFVEEPDNPYTVRASSSRFAVLTRKPDKSLEGDRELLQDYDSFAWDEHPIYTIIDSHEWIRGPHDLVFNSYDFNSIEHCEECVKSLEAGEIAISHRRRVNVRLVTTLGI